MKLTVIGILCLFVLLVVVATANAGTINNILSGTPYSPEGAPAKPTYTKPDSPLRSLASANSILKGDGCTLDMGAAQLVFEPNAPDVSHTSSSNPVPEPSAFLALITGTFGLIGFIARTGKS